MTPTPTATLEAAWAEAQEQARQAWIAAKPSPIMIYSPKGLFDDTPDLKQPVYYEAEGVCGFGWIIVEDGRSRLAKWLAKQDIGTQSAYYGGRMVSSTNLVPEDQASQSLARKEAAVYAAAKVLQEAGFRVRALSRID